MEDTLTRAVWKYEHKRERPENMDSEEDGDEEPTIQGLQTELADVKQCLKDVLDAVHNGKNTVAKRAQKLMV
jgi:hypothetical protein